MRIRFFLWYADCFWSSDVTSCLTCFGWSTALFRSVFLRHPKELMYSLSKFFLHVQQRSDRRSTHLAALGTASVPHHYSMKCFVFIFSVKQEGHFYENTSFSRHPGFNTHRSMIPRNIVTLYYSRFYTLTDLLQIKLYHNLFFSRRCALWKQTN